MNKRLTEFVTPAGMCVTTLNIMKHYSPCIVCRHNAQINTDANGKMHREKFSFCNTCEVKMLFNRLKKYEDLDEQGLLVSLPCKNWLDVIFGEQTTFWGIDTDYIENPIREISIDNSDRITWHDGWKTVALKGHDENGFDWEFSPVDIGKTVFFTQAEAEAKLKELRKGSVK